MQEGRSFGKRDLEGVAAQEGGGAEKLGRALREGGGRLGDGKVSYGDVGELRVKFHTEHLPERIFGCDQHRASLAGTDIEEGVTVEREGRSGPELPDLDERAKDGWGDAVVGRDVPVGRMAGEEFARGNEAAGIGPAEPVEGMDGTVRRDSRSDDMPRSPLRWGHGR